MRHFIYLVIFSSLLLFTSCGVAKQIEEAKTFAKCDFSLQSVDDTHLGDINIQGMRSAKDLSLKKAARLAEALTEKVLPLEFTLNINAENPNHKDAAMNRLEWQLFLDGNQLVTGVLEQKVVIPADSSGTFPLAISIDLKKAMSGESAESLAKLAFNVAGAGKNPSKILIKAKPSIDIAGFTVEYPGYIDIKAKVTSEMGKEMREKAVDKKMKKKKQ